MAHVWIGCVKNVRVEWNLGFQVPVQSLSFLTNYMKHTSSSPCPFSVSSAVKGHCRCFSYLVQCHEYQKPLLSQVVSVSDLCACLVEKDKAPNSCQDLLCSVYSATMSIIVSYLVFT